MEVVVTEVVCWKEKKKKEEKTSFAGGESDTKEKEQRSRFGWSCGDGKYDCSGGSPTQREEEEMCLSTRRR